MKITLFIAFALGLGGCTDAPPPASAPAPTPSPAVVDEQPSAEAAIYSAVVRRLVTKDHTFGRRPTPFELVHVVAGEVDDAGDPMGDLFDRTPRRFPADLVSGMRAELRRGLPPVRFVDDPDDALGPLGTVRNDGVLVALGPIERRENGRAYVPSALWCGGKCARWQTYVLVTRNGRWRVAGTTGPTAIS